MSRTTLKRKRILGKIGPADALQISIAKTHNAEAFITNDAKLRKIGDIKILLLNDYTPQ